MKYSRQYSIEGIYDSCICIKVTSRLFLSPFTDMDIKSLVLDCIYFRGKLNEMPSFMKLLLCQHLCFICCISSFICRVFQIIQFQKNISQKRTKITASWLFASTDQSGCSFCPCLSDSVNMLTCMIPVNYPVRNKLSSLRDYFLEYRGLRALSHGIKTIPEDQYQQNQQACGELQSFKYGCCCKDKL